MQKRITAMFFSATGTTKKIVTALAAELVEQDPEFSLQIRDFTSPAVREKAELFLKDDILILGVPVYAGRVPNVLLKYLKTVGGQGAFVIPIVVYGNRDFDDALIELKDILEENGFTTLAGGAFIAEHSFSTILAQGRPDQKDLEVLCNFARQIYLKLADSKPLPNLCVKGNQPYRPYYAPRDREGNLFDFRRITPKTYTTCVDCKLCSELCPMGSIDYENVSIIIGPCIKCCACIKNCPAQAKYFDDPGYLNHKLELEIDCALRKEPVTFV